MGRAGLFGPVVKVPDDAPAFDRVLGLAGRDPGWRPYVVAIAPICAGGHPLTVPKPRSYSPENS